MTKLDVIDTILGAAETSETLEELILHIEEFREELVMEEEIPNSDEYYTDRE